MASNPTTKKVKVIGTQQYINPNTGELVEMQVTSVEDRDFNFSKVWMRDFLSKLDIVSNAKTKVAFWVIENLDKENQLTYTYRQIAEATGISADTVTRTMTALLEANFLRRKNIGCYVVNPDIVFKGSYNGRMNILTQYHSIQKKAAPEPNLEEQFQNIVQAMQKLAEKAIQIQAKINARNQAQEAAEATGTPLPGQTILEDVTEAIGGLKTIIAATDVTKPPRRETT